jgi:hypothetical protein
VLSQSSLTTGLLGAALKADAPAKRASRSLLQAGTGALVCDGTVRQLDMPAGNYPEGEGRGCFSLHPDQAVQAWMLLCW